MSEKSSLRRSTGRTIWRAGSRIIRGLSLRRQSPKLRVWSIGIYAGDSPLALGPHEAARNPVLTWGDVSDAPSGFVADPFMIKHSGTWYMFFEVLNRRQRKGEIGLAVSADGIHWRYRQIVLAESFHLSYPYVFEWENDIYMIPESRPGKSLRLYRASAFPTRWSPVRSLLNGAGFSDSSLVRFGDKWWIFTETSPNKFDTLRLYYATDLIGPWYEHPQSPIVQADPRRARPAGRVLVWGERLVRFAQDCRPVYGSAVRAFEVTELTTEHYREREVADTPVLGGSGRGWNASGMHHVDAHRVENGRWLACVDGWAWPARLRG